MAKKISEKKSPVQIGLSFKNNDEEQKLYAWLKQKLNPGIFLKEIAYREYLIETGKIQYLQTPNANVDEVKVEPKQEESKKTTLIKNEFGFDDDDE